MLTALILSALVHASPVVYDSGSSVVLTEKSVVLSRDDFKWAVVGLVDRSSLETVSSTQDSLIASLRKSNSTCSLQVEQKTIAFNASEKQLKLKDQVTEAVRDSSKVVAKAEFWRGFSWGAGVTLAAEATIAILAVVWMSR